MHGRRRVSMSARRAAEEIEHLARRGINSFHLRDTLFFANMGWVSEFCQEVQRRDLHVEFYGANGRVDTLLRLDRSQWRLLEETGFREILLGIESGHIPALAKIDKRIETEQSLDLLERASHTRIQFFLSTMIGVPGVDPDAEFLDTAGLLRRLIAVKPGQVSTIYIFSYAPYPGSVLFDEAVSLGFRRPVTLEGWGHLDLHQVDYPWGSRRRRRQAWNMTHYLLPRITRTQPSHYRIVEAVCRLLDPLMRRRWRDAKFDLFWERAIYGCFNGLRWLRKTVRLARLC